MKTFSQLIQEWTNPSPLSTDPWKRKNTTSDTVMHLKTGNRGRILRRQPTHVMVDYGNGKTEWHRNDEVRPITPLDAGKKFGKTPTSVN